jgi:hypothetical protein
MLSTSNQSVLSEFDESILVATYPNASKKELAEIKATYVEQLLINEKRREELKNVLPDNQSQTGTTTIDAIVAEGHMFGTSKGIVHDVPNLREDTNNSSNDFARFQTLSANQSVWVACQMSSVKAGTVWVTAKLGSNSESDNYVVVYNTTTNIL